MEQRADVLFVPDFDFIGPVVNISHEEGRKIAGKAGRDRADDMWDATMTFLADGGGVAGRDRGVFEAAMMADLLPGEAHRNLQDGFKLHFSRFVPRGSRHVQSRVTGSATSDDVGPRDPAVCNFGSGLQSTTFLRPDGFLATVVLNCGDVEVRFKLLQGARAVRAAVPPHCVQTYLFEQAGNSPFRERGQPFVGVNLGGWLVLEAWMWAAEMEYKGIRDEHGLVHAHGGPSNDHAIALVQSHWDSFVTEEDLDRLLAFGVNHVRVPIGWWLLDYDPADGFVDGGEFYLTRLLQWLQVRGMRCLLDLHALPGSQAASASFTGRYSKRADFFEDTANYERGKRAIMKLAELVLNYELNATTAGVVFGVELVNEPSWKYWHTSPGVRELYEEMVPQLRRLLPAKRWAIFLSFMESPRIHASQWLETMRKTDPESYEGVVYDAHMYHSYGDDDRPDREWDAYTDSCKTCCRDPVLLAPLVDRGLPMAVGEYSLNTGFPGSPAFYTEYFMNQLSLWASLPGMVGSFFWSHRVLRGHNGWYKEMSLLELVAPVGPLPPVSKMNLTVRCPGKDLMKCPSFNPNKALWSDSCEWEGDPEVQEKVCPGTFHMPGHGQVSLVPTGWATRNTSAPVHVVGGRQVVPHIEGRAYFAETCKAGVYNHSQYLGLQLLGKTFRYTADVSGAGCGCNAAFYLTSMRHNERLSKCSDYYCDANSVCGEACTEIDMQEANRYAWRSTVHSHRDPDGFGKGYGGGGYGWNGARDWTSTEYGPGAECIDTSEPFQVAISFPVNAHGKLAAMEVTLTQKGSPCPLSLTIDDYAGMDELSESLRAGMTPVISYWSSSELYWLDGQGADFKGPCAQEQPTGCAKSVRYYGFSVESHGLVQSASPGHSLVGKSDSSKGRHKRHVPAEPQSVGHLSKTVHQRPAGRVGGLLGLVSEKWPAVSAAVLAAALVLWLVAAISLSLSRRQPAASAEAGQQPPLRRGRPSAQGLLALAAGDCRQVSPRGEEKQDADELVQV